jgi:hypothetical protein
LENVRFHAGEVNNCPGFAQQLASLADVFVNDAFAVCHRHQASVTVSMNPAGWVPLLAASPAGRGEAASSPGNCLYERVAVPPPPPPGPHLLCVCVLKAVVMSTLAAEMMSRGEGGSPAPMPGIAY